MAKFQLCMPHHIIIKLPRTLPGDFPDSAELTAIAELLIGSLREELKSDVSYELALSVVDDSEMRSLNREYRDKDRTTDVLSFPQLADDDFPELDSPQLLGDIIISHEVAARQADEIGHSLRDELCRLLVHGLLHLVGYDHETGEDDAAEMRKREDELLERLVEAGFLE